MDWRHWVLIAGGVASLLLLFGPQLWTSATTWIGKSPAPPITSKPTAKDAIDSATVVAEFKSSSSGDPMYKPVLAAIKALWEGL